MDFHFSFFKASDVQMFKSLTSHQRAGQFAAARQPPPGTLIHAVRRNRAGGLREGEQENAGP